MKKCESKFNLPKKITSTTGLHPGIFNDDLSFTFNATDVHTTDPKELEKMFAELDHAIANYKQKLREAVEEQQPTAGAIQEGAPIAAPSSQSGASVPSDLPKSVGHWDSSGEGQP